MPGSKPGERRGGRKKGTPNRVTAEIKAVAQKHGPGAIAELARIMTKSETDQARVAAAKELLDRGYGKSTQLVQVERIDSLSDADIDRRIRAAAAELGLDGLAGGEGAPETPEPSGGVSSLH